MTIDLDSHLPKILKAYFVHKAKAKYIELQKIAFRQCIPHEIIIRKVKYNKNSIFMI
jgi:hypothetical protein